MRSNEHTVESAESIIARAREIVDPRNRQSYIRQACGSDSQKRSRVCGVLSAELISEASLSTDQQSDSPRSPVNPTSAFTKVASGEESRDEFQKPRHRLVLRPGTTVGPFIIRELLGEGGMGQVYVAEQRHPVRRKVAIKLIRAAGATPEMVARFEAEGQALALMDHPHIAKVLEMGFTDEGLPYIAMELVQGVPITEYADVHELKPAERLELVAQVCLAVRHAHRHGLIHRDLKPGNILVADIDGEHVPKVIDFGLAKAIEQPLSDKTIYTGFHRLMGTPMYMSPEQAGMGVVDIDTRSDVYSLGVLLFELLTGVPPFDRKTFRTAGLDEVRRIIRDVDPPKPSSAIETLSQARISTIAQRRGVDARKLQFSLRGDLDWIVMKALEKNRDRRYDSVGDLAEDIRRYLNNESVLARPPSSSYRLAKFVRRHKVMATVASTILVALLATTSISFWYAINTKWAKAESDERGLLAADRLEAMRYQSALQFLIRGELHRLASQLDTWKTEDGRDQPGVNGDHAGQKNAGQAGLMQLLESWARPQPQQAILQHTPINNLAIANDGSYLITVDDSGQVQLWPLSKQGHFGQSRTLGSHGEPCHAIAISPDGTRAASGSTNGGIIFWDLTADCDENIEITRKSPGANGIETITWSPDGRYVAAGARYKETWIATANGEEVSRIPNDQRHEALLFSQNSQELFVPTRNGIDVWSIADKQRIRTLNTRPLENVRTMCLAGEKSQWLVVGERFQEMLFVVELSTGGILGHIDCAASYARCLAASPDGRNIAASYTNGQIQVFRLSEQDHAIRINRVDCQFQAHRPADDHRLPLTWRDNESFYSAASDGALKRWNLSDIRYWDEFRPDGIPHLASVFLTDGRERPRVIAYDHLRDSESAKQLNDGIVFPSGLMSVNCPEQVVAISFGEKLSIISLRSGEILAQLTNPLPTAHTLMFSRNAQVLYACDNGMLHLWRTNNDWDTCQLVRSMQLEQNNHVRPQFADDGETLILEHGREGHIVELELASGQFTVDYHFADGTNAIAVSPNARYLAHCDGDELHIIDRNSGELVCDRTCYSQPASLQFMPDSRILLSVHRNGSLQATHVPTGNMLGQIFKPQCPIGVLADFSVAPDGRIVVTYQGGGTRVPIILGY